MQAVNFRRFYVLTTLILVFLCGLQTAVFAQSRPQRPDTSPNKKKNQRPVPKTEEASSANTLRGRSRTPAAKTAEPSTNAARGRSRMPLPKTGESSAPGRSTISAAKTEHSSANAPPESLEAATTTAGEKLD